MGGVQTTPPMFFTVNWMYRLFQRNRYDYAQAGIGGNQEVVDDEGDGDFLDAFARVGHGCLDDDAGMGVEFKRPSVFGLADAEIQVGGVG